MSAATKARGGKGLEGEGIWKNLTHKGTSESVTPTVICSVTILCSLTRCYIMSPRSYSILWKKSVGFLLKNNAAVNLFPAETVISNKNCLSPSLISG